MTEATISIIDVTLTFITGVLAVIIAYLVFQLQRHQREEAWVKAFTEIHQLFWTDPVMAKVRCWIQYDTAYLELRPILEKRKRLTDPSISVGEELLEPEYKCLDELDRFYNLMLEVRALSQRLDTKSSQRFWEKFYFDYWVSERISKEEGREELLWYVKKFYKELLDPQRDVEDRSPSPQSSSSESRLTPE